MRIVVTGGMGFIGSNFIHYILKNTDSEVVNVDALKYGSNPENLKNLNGRYRFVKGDISDYGIISELVKDADVVVNFAAETHVDRSISSPEQFFRSNTEGVFNILEAIRKENPDARFIQVSTDEVYGDIIEGLSLIHI